MLACLEELCKDTRALQSIPGSPLQVVTESSPLLRAKESSTGANMHVPNSLYEQPF